MSNNKILVTLHFKNESKKVSVVKERTVQELIEQEIAPRLDLQEISYFSVSEVLDNNTDRWLNHENTLEEENVTSATHLHFKVKFWKHPKDIQDDAALSLFYHQIQQNIISGTWGCTEAQAMKLAANQVQVEFGNFNSSKHKPGFLDAVGLALFLPPEHKPPTESSNRHYQKRIFDQHAIIPHLESRSEALHQYIEIAEQLPSYGITYFKVKDENAKEVYFGAAEEGIYIFSYPSKEFLEQYLFSHLRGWTGARGENSEYKGIVIQKREEEKKKRNSRVVSDDEDDEDEDEEEEEEDSQKDEIQFTTTHQQAVTIMELLSGYTLLLQTSLPKWRKASASIVVDTPPSGLPPSSLFNPPSTTARVFPPKFSSSVELFKSLYFTNCNKNDVPPVLKLCQQIDDATDRNSWLDKLDLSECSLNEKTLEPIVAALAACKAKEHEAKQTNRRNVFFNNISLTELDLSGNQIDPQKANLQAILHADLKILNLAQNKLGTLKLGTTLLAPLISNICTHLEKIDLSSNALTKETLEPLLVQRYISLHTLILNNNNKIGDKGCPLITNFISGCPTLTRVDIVNIGFKDEGLDSLCNSIKLSTSLQVLDISGNTFSAKAAFQLQKALANTKSLSRLVMGNAKLNQDVGKTIGESLKYNDTLTSLDCRGNSFSKLSYQSISQALKGNTRLCYLNLDGNHIDGACGMLCDALCDNKSLTSLSLRETDLGKGDFQFGQVLQKNSTLMNLDIANNALPGKCIGDLCEGLGENTMLIYLNLSGNPVGDEGVHFIVKALNYNEALVSLNLDSTQISDAGLKHLSEMLQTNEALKTLSLQHNNITEPGILEFLTALSQKNEQILKKVDFSSNKTKPESKDVIAAKLTELSLSQLNVLV